METVVIQGKPRSSFGKKASKAVRNEGLIPCTIYGGEEVIHFKASPKEFKKLIYTPLFKLAEVSLDNGKSYNCILKDIQFHPVKDNILHVDLLELVANKKINVELPLKFEGTPPGEQMGGKLIQKIRKVSARLLSDDLVDSITLDVSNLELGSSVRVRDIKAMEGIEILDPPGNPIASVEIPRALRSVEEDKLEGEGIEGEELEEGQEEDAETSEKADE